MCALFVVQVMIEPALTRHRSVLFSRLLCICTQQREEPDHASSQPVNFNDYSCNTSLLHRKPIEGWKALSSHVGKQAKTDVCKHLVQTTGSQTALKLEEDNGKVKLYCKEQPAQRNMLSIFSSRTVGRQLVQLMKESSRLSLHSVATMQSSVMVDAFFAADKSGPDKIDSRFCLCPLFLSFILSFVYSFLSVVRFFFVVFFSFFLSFILSYILSPFLSIGFSSSFLSFSAVFLVCSFLPICLSFFLSLLLFFSFFLSFFLAFFLSSFLSYLTFFFLALYFLTYKTRRRC